MWESDMGLDSVDFRPIEKFFDNIDFLVPGHERSSQYMVAIHREFYGWASQWVGGKVVLDAGCGEGFGSAMLAEGAAQVVGIDLKPELVMHARRRYALPNVRFEAMDCEAMGLAPGSFEAVVCDELIEHLSDYRAFMNEAQRVLAPGGVFVCATTNAGIGFTSADGSPMNRNHHREFGPRRFRRELEQRYHHVRLFSECLRPRTAKYVLHDRARWVERVLVGLGVKHKIPIGWRNFIRERMTGVKVQDLIDEGFEIVEGARSDSLYLIGMGIKA